jgi:hypothetical protein
MNIEARATWNLELQRFRVSRFGCASARREIAFQITTITAASVRTFKGV